MRIALPRMCGIEGSKREAANMIRSQDWMRDPLRSIAALVSRAGWQPPAMCGQRPLWSAACSSIRRGWQLAMTCS